MNTQLKILLLLFCLLSSWIPGQALADINKQEAASIAQSHISGRVIAVKPDNDKGTPVFRVRVLDKKGGLHIVIINRQDGKIISAH